MNHPDEACRLFLSGCNCAQSIMVAFCDVTGMDKSTAMKLCASFGGGMGRMREVCGACSGAFMVLGLLHGDGGTDVKKRSELYAEVQNFANAFREKNGSIICRELLNTLKVGTSPVASERNREYYASRPCARFVYDAAEMLDSFLSVS